MNITEIALILGTLTHEPALAMEPADLLCLSRNVYHEARDQGAEGMHAVAYVTTRRLRDGRWGATYCEVVRSPNQFSWYSDGKPDAPKDMVAFRRALAAAVNVVLERVPDPSNSAAYYYAHDLVQPRWAKDMLITARVGGHTFGTDCERIAYEAPLCSPMPPKNPDRPI